MMEASPWFSSRPQTENAEQRNQLKAIHHITPCRWTDVPLTMIFIVAYGLFAG
jgi:hypothetical protein